MLAFITVVGDGRKEGKKVFVADTAIRHTFISNQQLLSCVEGVVVMFVRLFESAVGPRKMFVC